jgi:exopolysaccharide biosynthesis predicted pyruvyltransferase EpsI
VLFPVGNRFFFNDNKRRIDKTRLKLEAAYLLSERFSLSLFVQHETDYFFAVAQFDQNGQMLNPDRRLNLLAPTVGVRAHLWLRHRDTPAERKLRSLPY